MKFITLFFVSLFFCPLHLRAGEKEEAFLKQKMLPLAGEFIRKNQLPYNADFNTNKITHYGVDFFEDRPGGQAKMMIEKRFAFFFVEDAGVIELNGFRDVSVKPDKDYSDATVAERKVILAQTNLLNDKSALALAEKYFVLQGHKKENFHPVEFHQIIWGELDPDKSKYLPLPFYLAEWKRKDVDLNDPNQMVPMVRIVVSGLKSNLASYHKINLPIGKDIETPQKKVSAIPPNK